MAHTFVSSLRKGDAVSDVYLVASSNFKQTRNNKHFIQMTLQDRTGVVKAILWEATRDVFDSFRPDDFVRIRGRVEEYQQNLQVIIDDIVRVGSRGLNVEDFTPRTSKDIDALEAELRRIVSTVKSRPVRELLESFLEDPRIRTGLRRSPAGKVLHHAYAGGLLEHIVSLAQAATRIWEVYPELDRDLLLAGAVLHDIGKIDELSYDRTFQYTDRGQLIGHILIGAILVEEKGRGISNLSEETLTEIQHLVASHHGEMELGSPKEPMTPEAIVLHYLDNLDAKLGSFRSIKAAPGADDGRRWSDYHPMFGRRLYLRDRRPGE